MNVGFSDSTFLNLVGMVFFVFSFGSVFKEQSLNFLKICVLTP